MDISSSIKIGEFVNPVINFLTALSPLKRPKWDLDVLKKIGLDCWADETIGERVLSDAEKINYQSTPVFMVCAVK